MSSISFKKILLAGTALVAVSAFASHAQATEIVSPVTILATDATGLIETSAGASTVLIDSTGGAITLGADAIPSLEADNATAAVTVTIDSSGLQNGVIFAGDILESQGAITAINIVEDNVTFLGNVDALPITAGDAIANPTIALLVNTANAENIFFDATISAVDLTDIINLTVTNTNAGANTVTFGADLGGAAANALDTLTLDATAGDLDVTFEADVRADAIAIGGAGNTTNTRFEEFVSATTITLNGAAGSTNNLFIGDEGEAAPSQFTGTIAGADALATNNITVVGGTTVTFNDDIGANIDAIQIGADTFDTSVIFTEAVASGGTITLGGDGTDGDINSITLDVLAGAFTVTPAITGADAEDVNTLFVTGNVANAATVTGAITGIDTIDLTGSAGLTATTVAVGAGRTLTITGGTVTGAVNITGAGGTVTLGSGVGITGTVDNTFGAGVSVLNIADVVGGTNSVITGLVGGTNSLSAINMTGTGIAEFDSAVKATTITASSTGTLQFDDNVTGTINLSADATVLLANGMDITGNIAAVGGPFGTLTLGGDNVITGTVGGAAVGTGLNQINLDGIAGDVTAFTGTVQAAVIVFRGDGEVTFADDVTGDIDFNSFDGIITLAAGANIAGNVESFGGGAGTLTLVGGTQTVSGDVGATGDLVAVNAGANGAVSTFSGTVNAADISVTGTGTVNLDDDVTGNLTFDGDGAVSFADTKTFTGDIDATNASEGTLTFDGAATVDGSIGANINALKVLTLGGTAKTVTVTGSVVAADTTNIAGNTLNIAGDFTTIAGNQLNFDITAAAIAGQIIAGTTTIDADTLVDINVATGEFIIDGQDFTLISGPVLGGGIATLNTPITGTALLTFTQVVNADDLVINAARTAIEDVVGITANAASVGAALEDIGLTGDATLDAVQATVAGALTAAELNEILEALSPTVDGGIMVAAMDAGMMTTGFTDDRIASLRTGDDGMTGMAAGMSANGVSLWVQGYGQMADQSARDGIDGYDSDTWGGALGFDTVNMSNNGVVGIMFNYGITNIDSDNANRTATDIDSYGVNLYGSFDLSQQMFVNGQLGYAYNDIEQTRHDSNGVPGSGLNSSGDFSGNQFSAKALVGRDYGAGYGLTLTPNVSAAYTHLELDGYTETGTGANLTVGSEKLGAFNLGVGVTAAWKLQNADGSMMKPSLRVGYAYDLIGDNIETTASFTGDPANTAFRTEGADPARGRIDAGAGLTYMTTANWDMSANYDYAHKEEYDAHSGILRMTSHF